MAIYDKRVESDVAVFYRAHSTQFLPPPVKAAEFVEHTTFFLLVFFSPSTLQYSNSSKWLYLLYIQSCFFSLVELQSICAKCNSARENTLSLCAFLVRFDLKLQGKTENTRWLVWEWQVFVAFETRKNVEAIETIEFCIYFHDWWENGIKKDTNNGA